MRSRLPAIFILISSIMLGVTTGALAQESSPIEPTSDTTERHEGEKAVLYILLGAPPEGSVSVSVDFRYWFIGLGIGAARADDIIPAVEDFDPPHSSLVREEYDYGYIGVDLKGYIDLFDDQVSLFAEVGYYSWSRVFVQRSTATGWYYEGGEVDTDVPDRIGYGGGVVVEIPNPHKAGFFFSLIAEYHSIRGFMGGAGFGGLL